MTATLGLAAGLSLAGVGLASQLPDDDAPVRPPQAVETARPATVPVGPVAAAPVSPAVPPAVEPTSPAPLALSSSVVIAQPVVVGPPTRQPAAQPPAPAPPAPEPVAPVVGPPVVAVPVVVEEPADPLALPSFPEPVMDAPPPVEAQPDSDIGEPAILEPGSEEIGGVVDHGTGHGPVEPGEVDELAPQPDPFAPGAETPASDTATVVID